MKQIVQKIIKYYYFNSLILDNFLQFDKVNERGDDGTCIITTTLLPKSSEWPGPEYPLIYCGAGIQKVVILVQFDKEHSWSKLLSLKYLLNEW